VGTNQAIPLILLVASLSIAPSANAAELCGLSYNGWQELFRKIQSDSKLRAIPTSPGFKAFGESGRTWTLTEPEGNAAHPSVACRSIIEAEGGFRIETQLVCFASKVECDRLAEGYRQLDQQMNEDLKKRQSGR
jgi:hypothetical protein